MRYRRRYYNTAGTSLLLRAFFYFLFLPFILLYWIIRLIIFLIAKRKNSKNTQNVVETESENQTEGDNGESSKYEQKESLITNYEKYFYDIFEKNFGDKYKIQTQVNLASVVNKVDNSKYQNELFRNIDFGFFDKETLKPLLLIEINDATHKNKQRYERDLKVKEILQQAKIQLITFYSSYDNKEDYVVNRLAKVLEKE